MLLTENALALVDDRLRAIRLSLSKKHMADSGSYSYTNPVTGEVKQGVISPEDQAVCKADLLSKLNDLKTLVINLDEP